MHVGEGAAQASTLPACRSTLDHVGRFAASTSSLFGEDRYHLESRVWTLLASGNNGGVMAKPIQTKQTQAKKPVAGETGGAKKIVATNRKARHDYEILDVYEAGIALQGSEVKALRDAKVQLKDAYARVERGEILLLGVHISPYEYAVGFGSHQPERARKLLLHKHEIAELDERIGKDHLTVLPLSIYFVNGRAKVELAVARGRKLHDKRQAMAERDSKLEMAKVMSETRRLRALKSSKSQGFY